MLVTCSIGRTSHQSLILYMVARLDTRWRDIEDGNGLPVTPAIPLQAKSIDQPSLGLDWLLLKPPDGVSFKRCLHDTVSLNPLPSVVRHSPKHQVARRPPIPKPGRPWAYPRRSQNVECWWRARCKPPSVAVTTNQRRDCVVSMIINLSASEHLPSSEAAFVLPISPPACLLLQPFLVPTSSVRHSVHARLFLL